MVDKCLDCAKDSECVLRFAGDYEPFCYPCAKWRLRQAGIALTGVLAVFQYVPDDAPLAVAARIAKAKADAPE